MSVDPRPGPRYRGLLRRARSALRLCKNLSSVAPRRDDTLLGTVLKVAGAAEIIRAHLEGGVSALDAFVAAASLRKHRSRQLVALFFDTPLIASFTTEHIRIDMQTTLVRASKDGVGALYFVRYGFGRDEPPDEEFYSDGTVDFAVILKDLWAHFDGRLNVRIDKEARGAVLAFSSFPISDAPVYGSAAKMTDNFVKKHAKYRADCVPRTYLFVGAPGTGKSTEAIRMVCRIGERILRMEASSLSHFGVREMGFLLGALRPDALVVDDIDKGDIGDKWERGSSSDTASLLSVLEWVKADHPEVVLVMTANSTDLPEALLRPGRVDEPVLFPLPVKRDRRAILRGYIEELVPKERRPSGAHVEEFVTRTDGFSGAWLREVALQLRYEPVAAVVKTITAMKKLQDESPTGRKRRRKKKRRTTKPAKAAVVTVPATVAQLGSTE